MEPKEVFAKVVEWINEYVDVDAVTEDVKSLLIDRFEELMSEDEAPVVLKKLWAEYSDDYALSYSEIKAVILEYIASTNSDVTE